MAAFGIKCSDSTDVIAHTVFSVRSTCPHVWHNFVYVY